MFPQWMGGMRMNRLGYYVTLSLRYRNKHRLQTLYSIMAITIAVILCFCSITVGMTIMNYGYETAMKHNHGCELWITEMPLNKDSIDGDEEWTPEQYKSMQKKLEALPEVRKTYLDKIYVDSDSADGDEWGYQGKNKTVSMELYFAAADRSDLKSCKEKVEEATGYRVYIDAEIAAHLGQGDDIDSMNQAAGNALIALVGALFASFAMLVIRNTMMLPVLERMKEYGVLRCVGMSKGQLYCMLGTEGILLTLVSTILGTGVGFGLLKACQGWINDCLMLDVPVEFHFYASAVVYSCLLCIGVTLFALLEPARQAAGSSIQEILRGGEYGIRKGSGKKKIKPKKHRASHGIGRLLGIEWEYAVRNMSRNPGSQIYLCIGVAVSLFLFSVVFSGIESTYATVENSTQGTHQEYSEVVQIYGDCSEKKIEEINKTIAGCSGVQKSGLFLAGSMFTMNNDVAAHIPEREEGSFIFFSDVGYDEKHLKGMKSRLVDGTLDYRKMVQQNGVILCDYQYNKKDDEGNTTTEDTRVTDYKVGDTIEMISPEAEHKVTKDFDKMLTKLEKTEGKEPDSGDTKKAKAYWKKAAAYLATMGYPVEKYENTPVFGGGYSVFNMKYAMQQCAIDAGKVIRFPILAIVKEDPYNSALIDGCSSIGAGLIMADQTMMKWGMPYGMSMLDELPYGKCSKGIGFVRDIRKSKKDVADYVKKWNEESENNSYELGQMVGDTGYADMEFGDDNVVLNRSLELVRKTGLAVGGFILAVCLLQIFNITAANITMRRKELWLLRAAGMSLKQMQKMIYLEKGISCLIGIIIGALAGYGASWLMVEKIMNQDGGAFDGTGGILFIWPWWQILLAAVLVYGLCLFAGRGHLRREVKQ